MSICLEKRQVSFWEKIFGVVTCFSVIYLLLSGSKLVFGSDDPSATIDFIVLCYAFSLIFAIAWTVSWAISLHKFEVACEIEVKHWNFERVKSCLIGAVGLLASIPGLHIVLNWMY